MKKLTAKEILEIIEKAEIDVSDFAYGEFDPIDLRLGEFEEVDSGGGCDRGSNWYSVKHFKDHDVYIKTTGYYQSHHGTEFYNGYGKEVKPQTKTITVYE